MIELLQTLRQPAIIHEFAQFEQDSSDFDPIYLNLSQLHALLPAIELLLHFLDGQL